MLLSVKTIATSPITLSGVQNINGAVGAAGHRVFVNGQANPIENGIYVMLDGAWYRDGDFEDGDHPGKTLFMITDGDYAKQIWEVEQDVEGTVGIDAISAEISIITPSGKNTDYYSIGVMQTNTDDHITDNSLVYKSWAKFIFPGTDNLLAAVTARAIIWVENSNKKSDFRIRDITNNNTIVEILNIDNENPDIITITNIQNAPTDEAIFEIQLRTQQTGGKYNMAGFAVGTNT
jgi:hypothetical protein